MTTFNILTPEACKSKITKIAKVGKALQAEIHAVAVSTLDHIRAHGDYTLALGLLGALPNGQRVQALVAWYRAFSGGAVKFSYDSTNKCWKCTLSPNRTDEQFRVQEASETTFADLNPEKGYSTMTFEGFKEYLKRTANKDGLNPDGTAKVEPRVRDLAAAFYAKLNAGEKVEVQSLDDIIPDAA